MSLVKFLFSRRFLLHLVVALAIVSALIFGLKWGLNTYTNHGETITVPDLEGFNETQIKRVLSSSTMRYEIIDSVYTTSVDPGVVVDQIPEANAKVKEGRKIFLTINAISPRLVNIPDIKYSSLRQAKSYLKAVGLKVGEIMYAPSENENVVMELFHNKKAVEANDKVAFGSAIDLVVGKKSTELTAVPRLIGLTAEAAKQQLASCSLTLGTVVNDNSTPTEEGDTIPVVYMQDHLGEQVYLGTSVNVWVTVSDSVLMQGKSLEGVN